MIKIVQEVGDSFKVMWKLDKFIAKRFISNSNTVKKLKFEKNCEKLRKIWRLRSLKFEYCKNILYISKNGEVENWISKNIYLKLSI